MPAAPKKIAGGGLLSNSLAKPLDLFEANHLFDNGPLVLKRDATGLGQIRAGQQRQADKFFKNRPPIELGWVGPKTKKSEPKSGA